MVILLGLTTAVIGKGTVKGLLIQPGMTVISTIKAVMPIMVVILMHVKNKLRHQQSRMK